MDDAAISAKVARDRRYREKNREAIAARKREHTRARETILAQERPYCEDTLKRVIDSARAELKWCSRKALTVLSDKHDPYRFDPAIATAHGSPSNSTAQSALIAAFIGAGCITRLWREATSSSPMVKSTATLTMTGIGFPIMRARRRDGSGMSPSSA